MVKAALLKRTVTTLTMLKGKGTLSIYVFFIGLFISFIFFNTRFDALTQ